MKQEQNSGRGGNETVKLRAYLQLMDPHRKAAAPWWL
jgi:hypothetical protein